MAVHVNVQNPASLLALVKRGIDERGFRHGPMTVTGILPTRLSNGIARRG